MPILKVPGGIRTIVAFWCDGEAADTSQSSAGLVLLALDRPLPTDCSLAILAAGERVGEKQCLSMAGLEQAKHRTIYAVAVEWEKFELEILSLAPDGEIDRIELNFDRNVDRAQTTLEQSLEIDVGGGRLHLNARRNAVSPATVLRLYQHLAADGVRPPAARLADVRFPGYRLSAKSPRSRAGEMSATLDTPAEAPVFAVELTARTREAAGALQDTRLWHASHTLLAESPATLGLFKSSLPPGFRPIKPTFDGPRLIFAIPGAAPGDILCLVPGTSEAAISLEDAGQAKNTPQIVSGPCVTFEIDRDARLVRWPRAASPSDRLIRLGENPDHIKRQLDPQLEQILKRGTGARTEIRRLAQLLPEIGAEGLLLQQLAASATSPAIFAVSHALLGQLLEACGSATVAAEIVQIADPRRASFLKRLVSPAVHLATERQDLREALLRRASGNVDPWLDSDGLRAPFDILFDTAQTVADGQVEPETWYRLATDPEARIAILAIAQSTAGNAGLSIAQRFIHAGVTPAVAELGEHDTDAILSFAEAQFAHVPANPALADAVFFAAADLSEAPQAPSSTTDIYGRLDDLRSARPPQHLIGLDDLRQWKNAIRYDQIALRLAEIEDLLATDSTATLRAIPRFSRDREPLVSGPSDAAIRDRLRSMRATSRWEDLARHASESLSWPSAARAALLVILHAMKFVEGTANARAEAGNGPRGSPGGASGDGESDAIRRLKEEVSDKEGLLSAMQEVFRREARDKEGELLRQAEQAGIQVDAAGRRQMRRKSEEYGADRAIDYLFGEVESWITRLAEYMPSVANMIEQADDYLKERNDRGGRERLQELKEVFLELRKDYIDGLEARLLQFDQQARDTILNDIPAVDQDLKSARDVGERLRELLVEVDELKSTDGSDTD
jgi:hypothetical protein